jgi:predicted Fe-S protein YdhL (DUF1289 family)
MERASLSESTAIESPCNRVCTIDMKSGYCRGCGRTGAEISAWVSLSPQERRAIMASLPARLATPEI